MYSILYFFLLFFLADCIVALCIYRPNKVTGLLQAKFTPGAIISEIRNKIAATVFSRNGSGAIIRNRVTPINKRSNGQTSQRQQLAAFASAWRGLTQAERDGWNNASPSFPQQDNLGQTIFLSGEQLFIRSNVNLTLIGQSTITAAPVPATFAVLSLGAIVFSAAASTVAYLPDPVPAGFELIVRATASLSPGRDFVAASSFRFIQDAPAAAASPVDVATLYEAIFGDTFVAGQKVFVEIFLVEIISGLAGQKVRGSVLVT